MRLIDIKTTSVSLFSGAAIFDYEIDKKKEQINHNHMKKNDNVSLLILQMTQHTDKMMDPRVGNAT